MPRLVRSALRDGVFHVTARGTDGDDIFIDDTDRRWFVSLLGDVVLRYGWTCHAYCLMSNHYHLVVEASVERLARGMQALNGKYAWRFNQRHGRRGHLFAERYRSAAIESDEHLEAACDYVLANPVRAGLSASVKDWPWSG